MDHINNISALSEANLIHSYELNGSLQDSFGGPSLVGLGGTITNGGYVFGRNQGLSLTDALSNIENYTIIVDITFNTLGPAAWQKILDFKNRTSDNGLYVYKSSGVHGLQFYPYSGIVGTVSAGVRCRYIITRSSGGQVKTYVNNSAQFIFDDYSGRKAVSDNNTLLFCIDDTVVPNENDTGTIHKIEIYNGPLAESVLPTLPPTNTPNPTPTLAPTPTHPTNTSAITPTPTPTPTPTLNPCERIMVLSICNANSITDDNFDVYLNGYKIGSVDLSKNELRGSVFIASLDPTYSITSPDFICPIENMVEYRFDPKIINETNNLQMINTQVNNSGNWGIFSIRNYIIEGNSLKNPCFIKDLEYSGSNGDSFNFNFDFSKCCYPEPTSNPICNIPCFKINLSKVSSDTWEATDGDNIITFVFGSEDLVISDSKGLSYWNKTIENWKNYITGGVLELPGCEGIKIGGFCDSGDRGCVEVYDVGFIKGGQNGAPRRYKWDNSLGFVYDDGSSVIESPWSISGNKIRVDFENDINCKKYNKYTQTSTFKIFYDVAEETNVTIDWIGYGEVQDPCYDIMNIKVNGSLLAYAHAPGGGKGCKDAEPVISTGGPPAIARLKKGLNTIELGVTTNDPLYHSKAYYEFTISPFSCCDCNLKILNVIEKETLEDGSKIYEITVDQNSGNCCSIDYKLTNGDWISVPSDKLDCSGLVSQNKILVTMLKDWFKDCPETTSFICSSAGYSIGLMKIDDFIP